jgi:RNA polymerase-binding transcription factor DksA
MTDYTQFKNALETELSEIEKELSKLGVQDLNEPTKWTLKRPDIEVMNADENEAADRNEEYHINSIVLDELTTRYENISIALKKIENGSYGKCEICDTEIETDRLDANPAARTCKKHMGQRNTDDK